MSDTSPSAWRIQQAVSAWESARARLLADDPDANVEEILGAETEDVRKILCLLLSAEQWASAQEEATDRMMTNLDERRVRFKRQKQSMRGTMFAIMDVLGKTKEVLPHGTISVRDGKPSVHITDEAALADRFVTIERVPNKTEIGIALRDGEVVDGAVLTNTMPTLAIRGR